MRQQREGQASRAPEWNAVMDSMSKNAGSAGSSKLSPELVPSQRSSAETDSPPESIQFTGPQTFSGVKEQRRKKESSSESVKVTQFTRPHTLWCLKEKQGISF